MWLQIKPGICHHLYGIYTVCYMDWLQMADKYTKLCVVSFYSVYLPVRGINLFQLLSDMNQENGTRTTRNTRIITDDIFVPKGLTVNSPR